MELLIIIFMIGGGVLLAILFLVALAVAGGNRKVVPDARPPERDRIAASLLLKLLTLGGMREDDAQRQVRKDAGLPGSALAGLDVVSWAETYAAISSLAQREWLLEVAVKLVAARVGPVPLLQYSALLDLSFALGFQTSALARLRELYRFEYVDHARGGRPASAVPEAQTVKGEVERVGELLRILELDESHPTRQSITSAYRKQAARHHPDRFHEESAEMRRESAAKFIDITRAYEILLSIYRD
jgi:hypothetical protein